MGWNLPTCNSLNHTFALRAHYSFELTGVKARSKAELQAISDSLLRALARILGLSIYLMRLQLQAHAPSLPPIQSTGAVLSLQSVAPPSTDFKANLRIVCDRCEFVLRRLHLVGQNAKALDNALSQGVCGDRCFRVKGPSLLRAACLQDCPEAQGP